MSDLASPPVAARAQAAERLHVSGVVQGVGFRPAVYRLAHELGLQGLVRNNASGVEILIAGPMAGIEAFARSLPDAAPPASVIESIRRERVAAASVPVGFRIDDSDAQGSVQPALTPDLAPCPECERELADPGDRRHRYPFTSCTNCGPRYSIVERLPFDRDATTMRAFPLCPRCRDEYHDPMSRRFHAQANACPDCGPRLLLTDAAGTRLAQRDEALRGAVARLREGQVVALKGLGGYQLLVDAHNSDAVQRLRQHKGRPRKPFAVMLPSLGAIRAHCRVESMEAALLQSPAAPIVLLRRHRAAGARAISAAVAPANPCLGVMLPGTPLHRLLADDFGGALVVTSGNRSGEPIYTRDDEARAGLARLADVFLTHDRRIARLLDDSVVQVVAGRPRLLRRARGYVPRAVTMPTVAPQPTLAMGAQQRATVALACGRRAWVSQHIGDLDSVRAADEHAAAQATLQSLLARQAGRVACDLHPDYGSTRSARESGLPRLQVQHHLAHVYAAMAEHGIEARGQLFGVAWDGTGLGSDASIWGGELFHVDAGVPKRVGSLYPFRLPGGDGAIRRPWRTALALCHVLGQSASLPGQIMSLPTVPCPAAERPLLQRMLDTGVRAPLTTSMGRLFDGVAVLLGIGHEVSFDGELAMQLQFAAERAQEEGSGLAGASAALTSGNPLRLDWRELLLELLEARAAGASRESCALAFHRGLASGLSALVTRVARGQRGPVLLTGGCFQNRLLAELCVEALREEGFAPLLPAAFPPNDGAIALGQLYAATLPAIAPHLSHGLMTCA